MKLTLAILLALTSLSASAQDNTATKKNTKTTIEDFNTDYIISELDEATYLISARSDSDGVCQYLTENESAEAISFVSSSFNTYITKNIEADPFHYMKINSDGEPSKLVKSRTALGNNNYISSIICKYEEKQ